MLSGLFTMLDRCMPYTGPMIAPGDPKPEVDLVEAREQPEDTGLGYMEFFDWLAGCSDEELFSLGSEYNVGYAPAVYAEVGCLTPLQRHEYGLRIWGAM